MGGAGVGLGAAGLARLVRTRDRLPGPMVRLGGRFALQRKTAWLHTANGLFSLLLWRMSTVVRIS